MNSGKLESHFDIVQMGLDGGAYVYEGAYELQPNSMLMMRGWEWKINEFENEINVVYVCYKCIYRLVKECYKCRDL